MKTIQHTINIPGEQQGIEGWDAVQEQLATLSTNSQHRIAEATHVGLLDDENSFEPSAQAIGDVVASIRTGAPVVTR